MIKYNIKSHKAMNSENFIYYAQIAPVEMIKYEEVISNISHECTVTRHDVKAVLSALEEQIYKALRNNQSVRLGDLGSFRPTLSSTKSDTLDDFTAKNIKGVRVRFTPSARMRYELSLKNPMVSIQCLTDLEG